MPIRSRARCRAEYSSTMASWIIVSSRCVAGLSMGMRAFSASRTMTNAIAANITLGSIDRWMRSVVVDHACESGGSKEEKGIEEDHQDRGFSKEANHHFPACPEGSKRGSDVHGREEPETLSRWQRGRSVQWHRPHAQREDPSPPKG